MTQSAWRIAQRVSPSPPPSPRRGEGIVEIATGCALATTSSDCFAPLAMTIIAVFLRAVPAQTLESLPAAGKAQSVFPLNLPSPPSFVAELLRRTGTRGEERYAPVRPERLPHFICEALRAQRGASRKGNFFCIVPLDPAYPAKGGTGHLPAPTPLSLIQHFADFLGERC